MINLDSILKSRDVTLLTKVHLVKAMDFPVVADGCESRTTKKTEHRRIDAFELWSWSRLLRIPWTSWRSDQSVLMEISPEYSLEGMMLKLKHQYFGHLMKNGLIGKDPDAAKDWRQKKGTTGCDAWMASPSWWTWVWANSGRWCWTGKPGMLQSVGPRGVGCDWATELNWLHFAQR